MRIAIVLDEQVTVGGGFQQSLSIINALKGLQGHDILVLTNQGANVELLRHLGIPCELYHFGRARRLLTRLLVRHRWLRTFHNALPVAFRNASGPFDGVLDHYGVDMVLCFFLSWVPDYLFNKPFIASVYDLCHREHVEFPEVSERFEFSTRERIFHHILPRAVAILVSSPLLGERLGRYYGIDASRILCVPFLPGVHARTTVHPSDVARVREKYSLPKDYVFYPAQLWPHKNHIYILEALRALAGSFTRPIHAVFCGSDFGNGPHIIRTAKRLGLERRIHLLGFVDSNDVGPLYAAARALVMPTYFGPTNLPPLEALAVGCPLIYSDSPEFRADLGDAALYCDLQNPASLAEKIRSVIHDPSVSQALGRAAARILERRTNDSYLQALQPVLDRFEYLRRTWTSS